MHQPDNNIQLPPKFAEKVLEHQYLFQDFCSLDIITKLNELYRIGIDYYSGVDIKKSNHFQKKMTKLLNDPLTLQIIKNRDSPPEKIKKIAQQSKIKEEISKFTICSEEYVKRILQKSEKILLKNEAFKVNNLNKQQEMLQSRILLKKSKSQERLMMKLGNRVAQVKI